MTRFWHFISSLSPAVLVVGIRLLGTELCYGFALIAIGILLLPLAFLVLRTRQSVTAKPITVIHSRDESQQVPTYLLTFVFPFLFIDVNNQWNALAYFVLIILIALMLFRSDLSLVNPAILIRGYHIYEVQSEGGEDLLLIARTRPKGGEHLSVRLLSGHFYLLDQEGTERMNA